MILLHQLDDISKAVCNVIDAAELCRSVHASHEWREAASYAFAVLSDYIRLLNADTTLYRALQLVAKSSRDNAQSWQLSEEEGRFAVLLQAEFERDGIHLSDEKREQVRDLQNRITHLESSFSHNLVHSRQLFTVHNARAVTDVIPATVLQQRGIDTEPILRLGNSEAQIIQTLLKYSPDADLGRQVFTEHMTAVLENLHVLSELVETRHELAVTQGFASYVERNLMEKMARSSDAVLRFLQTAAAKNQSVFRCAFFAVDLHSTNTVLQEVSTVL